MGGHSLADSILAFFCCTSLSKIAVSRGTGSWHRSDAAEQTYHIEYRHIKVVSTFQLGIVFRELNYFDISPRNDNFLCEQYKKPSPFALRVPPCNSDVD